MYTWFLGSHEITLPHGSAVISAVFAGLTAVTDRDRQTQRQTTLPR